MRTLHVNFPRSYKWRPAIYTAILLVHLALWHLDYTGNWGGLLLGLVVVCCGQIYMDALHVGPTEMNERFIRRTSALGTFELAWDEVQSIEMPARRERPIVFYARNKQLAIASHQLWTGEDKEAMQELFNRQIEKRGIPVERSLLTSWVASKNTKFKRTSQTASLL